MKIETSEISRNTRSTQN